MGNMKTRRDLTGAALADALGPSREVWVSGCSAEIAGLPELLDEGGVTARISGIISPLLNTRSYASPALGRRCRTFFLNRELRDHLAEGHVDLCPWTYSQIMRWLCDSAPIDAAIVMVSAPDAEGNVSLGVQCDFLPLFRHRLGRMIAVINPHMPFTLGEALVPLDCFSAVFESDQELLTLPEARQASDPQIDRIAANIAAQIPDGATVQCGIGRIPQAVFSRMRDHRDIRVHSGLVDDDILLLEDLGVLDRDTPIRTGVAMGSVALYRRIDRNPRFHFCATDRTHVQDAICATPGFRSVNAALQVDLFGQINAEMVDGRLISVPGGFPDFVRGAGAAAGARSIVAVQARGGAKTRPGIVAALSHPAQVTAAKTDVDMIVTEFGTAELRDLSMDQRAEALIGIAAPEDQPALATAWAEMRSRALGRTPT
ncbi:acetyl-CoA hydrolase/transferase C-terminal domain-containing protein [Paracoccus pantotrophus]|uniref:acetyl-CoA hydrolase/transferase C-terminal domain-containing protein n=1 Tax=Paracoccus pantotrophus TaxID=82367 RepID=UPI0004B22849|nr:acetyl-CoA hydrolase/transferase C-terminal domain-containing protein [Paracoccus pantotrophus]